MRYRPRILYFACITILVKGTEACASEGWTYAYSRSSCVNYHEIPEIAKFHVFSFSAMHQIGIC